MDLTLRYWSQDMKKYGLFFTLHSSLVNAEGEMVAIVMYSKMLEDGLPVERMATLVRDGPNVKKTIFQKINELILQDHPEFPG